MGSVGRCSQGRKQYGKKSANDSTQGCARKAWTRAGHAGRHHIPPQGERGVQAWSGRAFNAIKLAIPIRVFFLR